MISQYNTQASYEKRLAQAMKKGWDITAAKQMVSIQENAGPMNKDTSSYHTVFTLHM